MRKQVSGFLTAALSIALLGACNLCKDSSTPTKTDEISETKGYEPGSLKEFVCGIQDIVYFGFDKYNLTDASKEVLDRQVEWLSKYATKAEIAGRCDPRGTAAYNMALGNRRAYAAFQYMSSKNKDLKLSYVSFGKDRPINVCANTEEDYAKERSATTMPALKSGESAAPSASDEVSTQSESAS